MARRRTRLHGGECRTLGQRRPRGVEQQQLRRAVPRYATPALPRRRTSDHSRVEPSRALLVRLGGIGGSRAEPGLAGPGWIRSGAAAAACRGLGIEIRPDPDATTAAAFHVCPAGWANSCWGPLRPPLPPCPAPRRATVCRAPGHCLGPRRTCWLGSGPRGHDRMSGRGRRRETLGRATPCCSAAALLHKTSRVSSTSRDCRDATRRDAGGFQGAAS